MSAIAFAALKNSQTNTVSIASVQAAQINGHIGYLTKEAMDTDLAHNAGTLAEVNNDTIAVNNGVYTKTGASGVGSWIKSTFIAYTTVNIRNFGAKGDGVTDDTIAIQNAIDYASENNIQEIYFNFGVFMVDPRTVSVIATNPNAAKAGVILKSNVNLHVSIFATIKSVNTNEDRHNLLFGDSVENIRIYGGGKITGDLLTNTSVTGEFGYGISLWNCKNVEIENVLTDYFWGDGIFVSANADNQDNVCKNIRVINVVSDHNRRQGISVCGCEDFYMEGCTLSNTGTISGTLPMLGIDFEPSWGVVRNKRSVIRNCVLTGNMGGDMAHTGSDDLSVYDTQMLSGGTVYTFYGYNAKLYNCKIRGCCFKLKNVAMYNCDIYKDATLSNTAPIISEDETVVGKLLLRDCTISGKDANCFWFYSVSENTEPYRFVFDNCTFIYDGVGIGDMGGLLSTSTALVLYNSCKFLHTGEAPATGFSADNGTYPKVISINCYSDAPYAFYGGQAGLHSNYGNNLGARTGAPEGGEWAVGQIVYNSSPVPGGYAGWVYTASGWKGFGLIQA